MRSAKIVLDDRRDDLNEMMERQPALTRSFWEKLDLSWTYHECALEGVVVTAEEMDAALKLTAPVAENGKIKMAFLLEVRRQREAIELCKTEARNKTIKLDADYAKRLFETLTGGPENKGAMELRKEMPLHRTYFHDILQPSKIAAEYEKVFADLEKDEFLSLTPLQQATSFHHRFMTVFPFTDLSGRVGRLMLNTLLMHAGYLPAVIHGIDRQRYFDSLRHAPRLLQGVLTEAVEHVTEHGFKYFAAHPAPASSAARSRHRAA